MGSLSCYCCGILVKSYDTVSLTSTCSQPKFRTSWLSHFLHQLMIYTPVPERIFSSFFPVVRTWNFPDSLYLSSSMEVLELRLTNLRVDIRTSLKNCFLRLTMSYKSSWPASATKIFRTRPSVPHCRNCRSWWDLITLFYIFPLPSCTSKHPVSHQLPRHRMGRSKPSWKWDISIPWKHLLQLHFPLSSCCNNPATSRSQHGLMFLPNWRVITR